MSALSKEANEKHTGRTAVIIVAASVCVISVIVMVCVLKITGGKSEKFVPPPFEDSAVKGTPDVPEDLGWEELNAENYRFSVCGIFTLNGNKADVWLTNPKENSVWLKVRVLGSDGSTLGETGLIKPDEYVKSVKLNISPKSGDSVTMKIMAYEPDTYYSAGVVSLNTTVKGEDAT